MEKLKNATVVFVTQSTVELAFGKQNPPLDVQDVGLEPFLYSCPLVPVFCKLHVLPQLPDAVKVLFGVAIRESIRVGDIDGVLEICGAGSGRDLFEVAWARGLEIPALATSLLLAKGVYERIGLTCVCV